MRIRRPRQRIRRAHSVGSASVELVVLTPALLLFLLLAIYGGRYALARQSVQAAAAEAARSASISRTAGLATQNAHDSAITTLESEGVRCLSHNLTVDVSAFRSRVGTPGSVRVRLDCTVDLTNVGLPGAAATRTVFAEAVSPLDTYRER